jgi:hypothetical protein
VKSTIKCAFWSQTGKSVPWCIAIAGR